MVVAVAMHTSLPTRLLPPQSAVCERGVHNRGLGMGTGRTGEGRNSLPPRLFRNS